MEDGDTWLLGRRRRGILDDVLLEVLTLGRELEAVVFELPNLSLARFPATKLLQAAVLFLQQAHTCQSLRIDHSTTSSTQSKAHGSGDVEVVVGSQRLVLVRHSIEGHIGSSTNETHTGSIGDARGSRQGARAPHKGHKGNQSWDVSQRSSEAASETSNPHTGKFLFSLHRLHDSPPTQLCLLCALSLKHVVPMILIDPRDHLLGEVFSPSEVGINLLKAASLPPVVNRVVSLEALSNSRR